MSVADAIESNTEALVSRSVEAMYENPFWKDRFGARGESFAREDHAHHVRYLVEAMRSERPEIVSDYARWLQSVLTTRGMCTLHVAESFRRVADAVVAEALDPSGEIAPFLAAATAALRYPSGDARVLQDAAPSLAVAATSAVRLVAARTAIDDAHYQLAYAADAVALSDEKVFVAYVTWRAGFLERRQLPADALVALVSALRDAARTLPDGAQSRLSELTTRALGALSRGSS